jgi:RNA recognition motif-containing protein
MTLRVVVSNLSSSLGEDDLREVFSECGTVLSCTLENQGSDNARCLVTFASEVEVSAALLLSGVNIGGKALNVTRDFSLTEQDERVLKTIYVGNLPVDVSERELEQCFDKNFGSVQRVKISGSSSAGAFAFIEFKSLQASQQAKALGMLKVRDREAKIGPAQTAISDSTQTTKAQEKSSSKRRDEIKRKLRQLQDDLKLKYGFFDPEDRNLKRGSSRSPSRSPRGRRGGSRSDSKKKGGTGKEGMFWDGFQWIPAATVSGIAQNPAYIEASRKE